MATEYPMNDAELIGRMRDGDRLPAGTGERVDSGMGQPGFTHTAPPGGGAVRDDGSGTAPPAADPGSFAQNGTEPRSGVPIGRAQLDPSHVEAGMTAPIPGDYPSNGSSYPNIIAQPTHVAEAQGHLERGLRDAVNPPI